MSVPDLLFVSNGHGEDAIAARIARELPDLAIVGLPLVGPGNAYRQAGLPVLGPARALPSGGWAQESPAALLRDLRAGLLGGLGAAWHALRDARPRLVCAVGDLLPAAFGSLAGHPTLLVGCNKSAWYDSPGDSYLGVEIAFLRQRRIPVLARDRRTHDMLSERGVRTIWCGNPMVDLVDRTLAPGSGLGLLPGSRQDAHANLPLMLEAAALLGVPAKVALAPGLEHLHTGQAIVTDLAGALDGNAIVLATAGTAAEVAAAHGRPVIAFPGPGPQYTSRFARRQQALLGPALRLVARDAAAVAEAARCWLADGPALETARQAGQDRIGEPGGAARTAAEIRQQLFLRA